MKKFCEFGLAKVFFCELENEKKMKIVNFVIFAIYFENLEFIKKSHYLTRTQDFAILSLRVDEFIQ